MNFDNKVNSLSYRIAQVDKKMMMLFEKYENDRSFLDAFEYIESKSEYQNKEYKAKQVESLINSIEQLVDLEVKCDIFEKLDKVQDEDFIQYLSKSANKKNFTKKEFKKIPDNIPEDILFYIKTYISGTFEKKDMVIMENLHSDIILPYDFMKMSFLVVPKDYTVKKETQFEIAGIDTSNIKHKYVYDVLFGLRKYVQENKETLLTYKTVLLRNFTNLQNYNKNLEDFMNHVIDEYLDELFNGDLSFDYQRALIDNFKEQSCKDQIKLDELKTFYESEKEKSKDVHIQKIHNACLEPELFPFDEESFNDQYQHILIDIEDLEYQISGEDDWWLDNHYTYLYDYMKKDKNTLELLDRLLVLERDHS
jgi:hypothetical protein